MDRRTTYATHCTRTIAAALLLTCTAAMADTAPDVTSTLPGVSFANGGSGWSTVQLLSDTPVTRHAFLERDGDRPASVDAALPEAFRHTRHYATVAIGEAQLYVVGDHDAYPLVGCPDAHYAIVKETPDKAAFLGTMPEPPRAVVSIRGESYIHTGAECEFADYATLRRIARGLEVKVSYFGGYEGDSDSNRPRPAVPYAVHCASAATRPATTICSRPDLRSYDHAVAEALAVRKAYLDRKAAARLDAEQARWEKERDRCALPDVAGENPEGEYGCLSTAMAARITALETHPTPSTDALPKPNAPL
jgi:hypothetical protein